MHIKLVGSFLGPFVKHPIYYFNSDDVGEEVADTVEDQVQSLREQLQTQAANHYYEKLASVRDRERQLAEKDRQLAEKDRELQTALQSQLEGQPLALGLIAELRRKIEEFEQLSQVGIRVLVARYMRADPHPLSGNGIRTHRTSNNVG